MFAIYAESDSYVHLVTAPTSQAAVEYLIEDIEGVCVKLGELRPQTVFAVHGRVEDVEMEDRIVDLIKKAQEEV